MFLPAFSESISEQAILSGKVDLASTAAQAAMPFAANDSPEKQRLLLYNGAALIVTKDFARGLDALNSVQTSNLDNKDRELHLGSLALAAKLRATPAPLESAGCFSFRSAEASHDFLPGQPVSRSKSGVGKRGCNVKTGKAMPQAPSAITNFSPGRVGHAAAKALSQPSKDATKTFASLLGIEKPAKANSISKKLRCGEASSSAKADEECVAASSQIASELAGSQ